MTPFEIVVVRFGFSITGGGGGTVSAGGGLDAVSELDPPGEPILPLPASGDPGPTGPTLSMPFINTAPGGRDRFLFGVTDISVGTAVGTSSGLSIFSALRSEERRVGKECRFGWAADQ